MTNYLYRLRSDSELLYVGITKNPTTRLVNHRATKPWWSEVVTMTFIEFSSLEAALDAEATAIQTEHPRYNQRNDTTHPHRLSDIVRPEKRFNLPLPEEERTYLRTLETDDEVVARAYELFRAGWPMTSIIANVRLYPSSSYLRTKFAETVAEPTGHLVPIPGVRPEPMFGYRISSRHLTSVEIDELRKLQTLASRYRPQHYASHPYAVASETYNRRLKELHFEGITATELAEAVGVDSSNIRRRIRR